MGELALMHSHTLSYLDTEDLISQLDTLLAKLRSRPVLTAYHIVRARYPHLSGPAFTMRLKRFEGEYPKEMSPTGTRTVKLFVTQELDEYLRK